MTAPSYEQLAALVAAQERIIAQLRARLAEQDARIAELERQLAASSRNSSKPPSTDGLNKPAPMTIIKIAEAANRWCFPVGSHREHECTLGNRPGRSWSGSAWTTPEQAASGR